MSKNDKLPYLTDSETQNLLRSLTAELRDTARNSNWPEHLTNALSVTSENGNLIISYPVQLMSEIDYLEYGDLNDLPNAVLRPFAARLDTYIDSNVGALMANNMLMGVE